MTSWRRQQRPSDFLTRQQEVDAERRLVELASDGDAEGVRAQLAIEGVRVNAEAYNMSLYYKAKNYRTPLHYAAAQGHADVVQVLIEHRVDLDALDMFGMTAVHLAAQNGHLQCLRKLLDAGASCNIGTATKRPQWVSNTVYPYSPDTRPLHLAAQNNHVDCILELMLNGADYNCVDGEGRTPLYISAEGGHEGAILAQLQNAYGKTILSLPSINSEDTPLHFCVTHALTRALDELLAHGSDVNHRNRCGLSPLHLALFSTAPESAQIVSAIVKRGYNTDINLRDSNGISALEYVCLRANSRRDRRPAYAAFLIAYGADFQSVKSPRGQTLLQQELGRSVGDSVVLRAMVSALPVLPTLASLGIRASPHGGAPMGSWIGGGGGGGGGGMAGNIWNVTAAGMLFGGGGVGGGVVGGVGGAVDVEGGVVGGGGGVGGGIPGGGGGVGRGFPGGGGGLGGPPPPMVAEAGWRAEEMAWDAVWREYKERLAWYAELAAQPRALQHCCRVAVRRAMGPRRLRLAHALPLPTSLRNYLLLDVEDLK